MQPNSETNPTAADQALVIDVGAFSDPGKVRETNDDGYVVADLVRSVVVGPSSTRLASGHTWFNRSQGKILVVADGITGAGAADVASSVAVRAFTEHLAAALPWRAGLPDDEAMNQTLCAAMERCQREVNRAAASRGLAEAAVGTALTAAYVDWPKLYVAHVGDTRAYLMRGGRLIQLTSDDTLAQELVDREIVEPGEGGRWKHVLTNAVGGEDDELTVEVHSVRLRLGDQILLCSDGLVRHAGDLEIAGALEESVSAALASRKLGEMAIERGGEDNVTVVIAGIEAAAPTDSPTFS